MFLIVRKKYYAINCYLCNVKMLPCILLALLLFAGCTSGSHTDHALDRAGALMMEHPDSAIAILGSIDASSLSDARRARHALYTACAINKQEHVVDDSFDSLLSICDSFYSCSVAAGRDDMLASYYNGLMLFHHKSYEYAIISFLKAEEIAKTIDDHTQLGLIYRAISESFLRIYNFNSAAKYSELSLSQFEKASAQKYIPDAVIDLATAYCNASRYDDALRIAQLARQETASVADSTYFPNIITVEGTAFSGKHDYKNVRRVYTELLDSGCAFLFSSDIRNYGIACLNTGDVETAKACDAFLAENDSTERLLRYFIHRKKQEYKEASECLEYEFYQQDSVVGLMETPKTEIVLSDFYNARNEMQKQEAAAQRNRFFLMIWAVAIISIILLLLLLFQRQKYISRRANLMLELQTLNNGIAEIAGAADSSEKAYQKELESANRSISAAKQSIRKVLSSQSHYINEICRTYYEMGGAPSEMKKIYRQATGFINSLRGNNEMIIRLEAEFNTHLDNLIDNLRNECPKLTADDVSLYIYLVAGLSPQAIAVILQKPVQNVYLRKSRLIEKIKKYNPEKSSVYLGFVGQ